MKNLLFAIGLVLFIIIVAIVGIGFTVFCGYKAYLAFKAGEIVWAIFWFVLFVMCLRGSKVTYNRRDK